MSLVIYIRNAFVQVQVQVYYSHHKKHIKYKRWRRCNIGKNLNEVAPPIHENTFYDNNNTKSMSTSKQTKKTEISKSFGSKYYVDIYAAR